MTHNLKKEQVQQAVAAAYRNYCRNHDALLDPSTFINNLTGRIYSTLCSCKKSEFKNDELERALIKVRKERTKLRTACRILSAYIGLMDTKVLKHKERIRLNHMLDRDNTPEYTGGE